MNATRLDETDRYCVFRHGGSLFALPATCVLEVAENPGISSVPGSDAVLAGLCHLRNEFLPVLDLSAMAGENGDDLDEQQLLVISGSNGPWAVLVDRVIGLESLEVSISQDIRSADDWSAAMIGSATLRNQVIRILEPCRVYRLADSILRHSWANVSREKMHDTLDDTDAPMATGELSKETQS
ncbi:MAG: chemotaxis protein CheW [Pirellulaceae bacterium]|jgi:chemotaxis signal transduction protein|nr:chemotaxis protein CheW [Pirellulaceae bacterium]